MAGADPVAPDAKLLDALRAQGFDVEVERLPGIDGMLGIRARARRRSGFRSIQSWISSGQQARRRKPGPAAAGASPSMAGPRPSYSWRAWEPRSSAL